MSMKKDNILPKPVWTKNEFCGMINSSKMNIENIKTVSVIEAGIMGLKRVLDGDMEIKPSKRKKG
jgi:hypothetical protein